MICNTYAQFFKTVAETSRIELLFLLTKEDLCVHEIVEKTGKEQSSVSHNLRMLKERGFVESKKEGKHRRYKLTKESRMMLESMDGYVKKYFHKDCRCGK